MADVKISQLTAKAAKVESTDRIPIADYNGTTYDTKYVTGSEINEVSLDTSPQLGGNLDINTYSIVSTSNSNINITPNGTGNLVLSSDFNSSVFVGNASTPAPLSISGGIGGNSALVVNQLNSGDIITASSSGVTRFRVQNTGELVISDNASSFYTTLNPALLTQDRTLTLPNEDGTVCVQGSLNCGFALGTNYFQLNNNLLTPINSTYDLVLVDLQLRVHSLL